MKRNAAFVRSIISMFFLLVAGSALYTQSGCARIVPPSGGPKDTLPPVLVKALPRDSTLHMPLTALKIELDFDEYVQLDNASSNLIVNPTLKMLPIIESKLKVITVKIKDTLEANTTYTLNFGNAVKDVNEGNILRNFTYFFSTGAHLDSGELAGRVILAKDNKVDTSLLVILHRHYDDSAVAKETPRYTARLDRRGRFFFHHIATGTYSVYALKDVGDKKYHDKSELFAFYDTTVTAKPRFFQNDSIFLYAYKELATKPNTTGSSGGTTPPSGNSSKKNSKKEEKKLHVATNLKGGKQDLLTPLYVTYDQRIKTVDSSELRLCDSGYHPLKYTLTEDTSNKIFGIIYPWQEDSSLILIIGKNFATDTSGVVIGRSDTITFKTMKESEYGSLLLRLRNFDLSRHPVLQFIQNDKVVDSIRVTTMEPSWPLYHPGEYELRILYDTNGNGIWDPGSFFGVHRQPEKVVTPKTPKIKVRGNGWENEYDVVL